MIRSALVVLSATAFIFPAFGASPEVQSAVNKSLQAMGAENLKTVVISGQGFDSCVGQPFNPNSKWWRKYSDRDYVRSIDFDAKGWRLQRIRGEGENPPGGGCGTTTPAPDQMQNQVTRITDQTPWNTQLEYILLPEGFLRTALEKDSTVKSQNIKGKKYTVISFMGDNKAPVTGYIDSQGYVDRVQTKIDVNPLGDVVWDALYTNWKDFNGLKFPTHIAQYQGDPEYFELNVSDVKPNAPVDLTPPAGRGRGRGGFGRGRGGRGRGPAGPISEDLGGGFWLITGGYGSVVANFNNYIVVIEGPQNEMRAEQIMNEAKRLVPNKSIRYVVNTHAHFDHSGGLRAFVAEGATIVTSQVNKGYYEKIFKNPHTLVPDRLSQMNPQPKTKVEYVGEKKILTDGTHSIEIYHVQNSTHNAGMLMVYLPADKVLIEADEFNVPGRVATEPPATINSYQTNLLANIERLKLNVDRIIPIHLPQDNRKVAFSELKMAAGKPN